MIRVNPLGSIDKHVGRIGTSFGELGDIIRVKGFGVNAFCFRSPDDIKLIYRHQTHKSSLVFNRVKKAMGNGVFAHPGGEAWKARRRAVSKAFPKSANRKLLAPLDSCISDLEKRWNHAAIQQSDIDIQLDLNRLIADYAFRAFFSEELADRLPVAGDAFHDLFGSFLDPTPLWVPTASNLRFKRSAIALRGIMREIVGRRVSNTDPPEDVLSVLLDNTTAEDAADQMVSIFSGTCVMIGSLTWMFYMLARAQKFLDRLDAELISALGERTATLDDLSCLQYPSMIFNETVRLYPAAWMTPRVCQSEFQVDRYRIPAKSFLFPMVYFLHRHPSYWESPEAFNPDRFRDSYEPAAFFPFGGGSRMCPGASLAPQIAQYILVRVCQRYRLTLSPSVSNPVKPTFGFELSPSKPILMRLQRIMSSNTNIAG